MSKKPSKRSHRISDLIKSQLGTFILREISDPRLKKMTITAVDMSPDLGTANVFFTTLEGDPKDIITSLKKASGYLRRLLAESTALRYIPRLSFVYDASVIEGEQLSALIDQVVAEDESHN